MYLGHLNSYQVNVSITIEKEKDNRISFFVVNKIHEQGKFPTSD